MEETTFLIDVISILPDGIDLYIQAPDVDDEVILNLWHNTEYDYYQCIKLNALNKEIFFNRIKNFPIVQEFQSIEIKLNGKLLFEGFDGVEIGSFSKIISIPNWFKEKYSDGEDDYWGISDEW